MISEESIQRIIRICENKGMRGAEMAIYLCKRGCPIDLAEQVLKRSGFKVKLNNTQNPTSLFISDKQIQFMLNNLGKATDQLICSDEMEALVDFLAECRNIAEHMDDIVQPLQEVIWDSTAWQNLTQFSHS